MVDFRPVLALLGAVLLLEVAAVILIQAERKGWDAELPGVFGAAQAQQNSSPAPTTTASPAPTTASPPASASPSASASPTPNNDDNLFNSGGPKDGPVPLMPDGGCPEEFPAKKDGACYP